MTPTSSTTTAAPPRSTTTTTTTTTVAPTTTTSTVAPTTSAPPPAMLRAWPDPPPPVALADVPHLLPTVAIEDVVEGIRTELERRPEDIQSVGGDYVQSWISEEGDAQVTIRTHLRGEPAGSPEFRQPVAVDGWESAFSYESSPPFASVVLVAPEGYVETTAYGVDQATLEDMARSLTRRGRDVPGWEPGATPGNLRAVHEGWALAAIGTASRDIDWFDGDRQLEAELAISLGQPDRFVQAWQPDQRASLGTVDGSAALIIQYRYTDGDAPTVIVWSPAPNQTVQFGVAAPPQRALEIARTIGPVSVDTWNSVTRPPEFPLDGCTSFIC